MPDSGTMNLAAVLCQIPREKKWQCFSLCPDKMFKRKKHLMHSFVHFLPYQPINRKMKISAVVKH